MNSLDLKKLLLGTSVLVGAAFAYAAPTYAQDADDMTVAVEEVTEVEEIDDGGDEVVVTGSRLKRDTFNSTAPIQVITTDSANEEGLFSPVEILQSNAAASGQQIDSTFQGFVLDNGPGSETINLRALGANRTLVLLNSRRMAPAGVEGAPTQPSINLVPRTMVDRFDLLLDGASAVYGSDAVAGVVNVILRNDYDGLELDVAADTPESGAGSDYTIGARWGKNGDRGFIGGAIEFDYQEPWTTGDRDFLNGCETFREVTETGEIRTTNIADAADAASFGLSAPTNDCRATRLTQRYIVPNVINDTGRPVGFGSIYYQPEISNTTIPGFSDSTLFGVPIDGDGDGVRDINFFERSPNGQQSDLQQLVNEQKQFSFFANGEYTFEGDMNITPYFETLYASREINARGQQPQLFPVVPSNNPFNPCNLDQPNGVDCAQAYNNVLLDPEFAARFQGNFGVTPLQFQGLGVNLFAPTGASLTAQPVVGVLGDRTDVAVEIEQTRLTGGVRGDLPAVNFGPLNDWEFDVAGIYSWSNGTSSRSGIRSDRLDLAIGRDPNTGATLSAPCTPNPGSAVSPLLLNGCVPVNLFATTLYDRAAGADFATQAERDYLFDSRDFDTYYSQLLIDAYVQGDVFELPGGEASLLLGASFRRDVLDSRPDDIARDGLFFGFFADAGAAGERTVNEYYFESSLPLGTGTQGWREFNVDLAGRLTDDEFYGENGTYSVKVGYRPIDSLLLKGTRGTSFRAPNLRELFLRGQSGFNTLTDPCAVPEDAFDQISGYDPTEDARSQITLANCVAAGLDPTSFLAGQNSAYSIEINQGGQLDLDPETSDSTTLGFSFEQPFTDAFDLTVGMTWFNLEVQDSIVEVTPGFIIGSCFSAVANLASPFCDRVVRDFADPSNPGVIDVVNAGFVNRAADNAEFVDYNFRFDKDDIQVFDRSIDTFFRGQISQYRKREFIDTDAFGNVTRNDLVGNFGVPEWVGSVTAGVQLDRWSAAWTTRFIDGVESDEFDDTDGVTPVRAVTEFTNFNDGSTVTCAGPAADDVNCRPVFSADEYFVNNLSVTYRGDDWNLLMGVSNIFNQDPPLVSPREVFSVNNVPIGNGYDLTGREYFVRVRKTF